MDDTRTFNINDLPEDEDIREEEDVLEEDLVKDDFDDEYSDDEDEPDEEPRVKMPRKKKVLITMAVIGILLLAAGFWLEQRPGTNYEPEHILGNPNPTDGVDTNVVPVDPTEETEDGAEEVEEIVPVRKKDFYTFLLLGTNDNYNTDVMMLASLDVPNKKIDIISIPRDSMVDVPGYVKKINGVYGSSGIEETKLKVQEVTGIIPDYYCIVNIRAFTKIVDVIGGVEFNVPYNMYMQDKEEQYSINLRKGVQTLDSNKALQLVRFRGTAQGDFDRINVQKDFLMAVMQKVKTDFALNMIPGMVDVVLSSIKTDMSAQNIYWFIKNGIYDIELDTGVSFYTLPVSHTGSYSNGSYVYLDEDAIIEMINDTVNPFNVDLTTDALNIIILEN